MDAVRALLVLERHKTMVNEGLVSLSEALLRRGRVHDVSKYQSDEFFGVVKLKEMVSGVEYDSSEYWEAIRKAEEETGCVSKHFERNRHHPEHFDCPQEEMGFLDIIEMVCDWYGAYLSYHSGGDGDRTFEEGLLQNLGRFGSVLSGEQIWLARQVGIFLMSLRLDDV